RVRDLRHVTLFHQDLDHVDAAFGHAVRQLLDRDGLGDRDFANELFLLLGVTMAGHALSAAAERRDRTLAHFVGVERRDEGKTAALLRSAGARGLGRRSRTRRHSAGAAAGRTPVVIVGFRRQRAGRRHTSALRSRLFLAETLLGDFVGLSLGFFVVAAAIFLAALARLGGLAFGALDRVARRANARIFLGDLAFLGLAQARVGERMRARFLFFLGQLVQHHARFLRGGCRRGRCCSRRGRRRAACDRAACCETTLGGGRGLRRLGFGLSRAGGPPVHLLQHHGLLATMAETLPHHACLRARLE